MGIHHSKCSGFKTQAMVKASCCDIARKILDAQPNWTARPSRRTKCPRHSNQVRSPTPYPRRRHRSPTPFPSRDGQRLHQQLSAEDYADEKEGPIEIESQYIIDKGHPDSDIPPLSLPPPMVETADPVSHERRRNRFERI